MLELRLEIGLELYLVVFDSQHFRRTHDDDRAAGTESGKVGIAGGTERARGGRASTMTWLEVRPSDSADRGQRCPISPSGDKHAELLCRTTELPSGER
jgi:hypothetical protein